MLYKKYHRDFVKQFKKGVKFKRTTTCSTRDIVEEEPFIFSREIHITSFTLPHWHVVLVDSDGIIDRYIHVV